MTAIADSQLPGGVVLRVIFTKSLVQDCTKTPNSGVTQDIIGTKHQPCDFLVIWLKFTSHRWRQFWYCSLVFTKVGDPASKHGVVASEPPRGHLNASLTDPQVLVMIQNPTMLNSPECLWCASQNYKTKHFLPVNLHLCRPIGECHWDKISAQIWFNPNESKAKRVELKLDKLKLMLRIWPQSGSVTKRLIIVGVCFYKCATAAFWPQVYILPGCKLVSHFSHKSKAKTCCKLVPIFTGLLFYKLVSIFIWFAVLFCYCCMSVVSVFGVSPRFGLCSCDSEPLCDYK